MTGSSYGPISHPKVLTYPLSDVVGWPLRNGLSAALAHRGSLGSETAELHRFTEGLGWTVQKTSELGATLSTRCWKLYGAVSTSSNAPKRNQHTATWEHME